MTKVKLNFAVTCDQTIIDDKGKLSILGIFQKIYTQSVPALHNKFTLVINTIGEPKSSYLQKIEIVNPQDNKSIATLEQKIEFKERGSNNFIGNFINTIFPNFGKYFIKITIDNEVMTNSDVNYISIERPS